jgi:hypothetical protein
MKTWHRRKILNDEGQQVEAIMPFIISASRSTDIPAFFSKWFFNRLEKGFVTWTNPFNREIQYVSFAETKVIVFWSKNPLPILPYLDELDKKKIHCYFQFTLNNYEKEGLEPNLPNLEKRIETFKKLSERIGKEKVIWRFDPLILGHSITVNELIEKIQFIGDRIYNYTEKLVFSFADIKQYKKVESNLNRTNEYFREFSLQEVEILSEGLYDLNKKWGLVLATCAENIDLNKYHISHNRCVDDELIYRIGRYDPKILDWLGISNQSFSLFNDSYSHNSSLKDKGQ